MDFRRNPRLYKERTVEIRQLRHLPVAPVKEKRTFISRALYPIIMVAAYGLMFALNQTSPLMLMFPLIMLVPALLVPAIDDKHNWDKAIKKYENEVTIYNQYLDNLEIELEQVKTTEKLWNDLDFPGCEEELKRCRSVDSTLWCKRAEHSDFTTVCLGTFSAQFPIQFNIDYEQMQLCSNEQLIERIQTILNKYKVIENAPLLVNLSSFPCLGIIDSRNCDDTQEYLAGILLSAIYSYGYDELKIAVIAKDDSCNSLAEGKYQWTRWLPHCWDADKTTRFFASTDTDKTVLLSYLDNVCKKRTHVRKDVLPHFIIIVEDISFFEKHALHEHFTQSKNDIGMSLIFVSDSADLPSQSTSILTIQNDKAVFSNTSLFGLTEVSIIPRKATIYDVEDLARFFSSIRLTDDNRANRIPSLITLFELYGERNLSPSRIALEWGKNNCYSVGIHALVGQRSQTEIMDLDMSDEHDGAHMLVAGTTGSGKSEFLQTFVIALAVRYSPNEVSFVFVDFKEGGMSESFRELPHNAGSLTNIDEEIEYFAGRAITMLNTERKYRAKILEPFGQNINRYHKAYHESGQNLKPLPHLFVVVDEFAEVISQCPEFKEMIVSLSRVGRSLGIHLILATQSPSQSVDSQIWSNSNCKICLKVLNEDESNAVLKTKDAAYISTRGRAYCLTGTRAGIIEFQTAWSGAPTSAEFMATKVEVITGVQERSTISKKVENAYSVSTQLSQLCTTCKLVNNKLGLAPPHIVLTPSLPTQARLKSDGIAEPLSAHTPTAYIGIGDYIYDYKQPYVPISFGKGNNHILISGGPNSGRSHIVGIIVSQLEATCDASDIQFYIIQYGSKALRCYAQSPLVSEYITNLVANDPESEEKIGRALTFVRDEIRKRQDENAATKAPKLIFVIDGWNQLAAAVEFYPDELLSIMALNPAQFGVHFIIISNVEQVGYKLNPYFDTRILMKYDKSVMSNEDFSFEGSVLPRKGRGVFFDSVSPYAIEVQIFDEVDKLPQLIDHSTDESKQVHIPTISTVFCQRGFWARKILDDTDGTDILLGLCKQTLEWTTLSFNYRGVAVSYVDILPKNSFIKYLLQSFGKYNIILLEEAGNSHLFPGKIITSDIPDELNEWAITVEDNTIIIIDHPGLIDNDRTDYSNLKMFAWQSCLRDKMAEGKIMIVWIEHVSRARNNSHFSDAICSYQKRIAIGGRGDRHPYFGDRLDTSNKYLGTTEAFVSLTGTDSMVIRTMF